MALRGAGRGRWRFAVFAAPVEACGGCGEPGSGLERSGCPASRSGAQSSERPFSAVPPAFRWSALNAAWPARRCATGMSAGAYRSGAIYTAAPGGEAPRPRAVGAVKRIYPKPPQNPPCKGIYRL